VTHVYQGPAGMVSTRISSLNYAVCYHHAGRVVPLMIAHYLRDAVLDEIGWYCGNSDLMAHGAGRLIPNSWGLYDMHGNFYEWCWDGYREDYENLPREDPAYGVGAGRDRIVRGGYCYLPAEVCSSAARERFSPSAPIDFFGFRPVRSGP
jgi:formylglycine-generating enzyme required for sulfatase activity